MFGAVLFAEQTVLWGELLVCSFILSKSVVCMISKRVNGKNTKLLILCILAASLLSPILIANGKAQSSDGTVGYWPLDEVKSSGSSVVTTDSTGVNYGIVSGHPE